jgi:hypothetical protein
MSHYVQSWFNSLQNNTDARVFGNAMPSSRSHAIFGDAAIDRGDNGVVFGDGSTEVRWGTRGRPVEPGCRSASGDYVCPKRVQSCRYVVEDPSRSLAYPLRAPGDFSAACWQTFLALARRSCGPFCPKTTRPAAPPFILNQLRISLLLAFCPDAPICPSQPRLALSCNGL